MWRRDRRDSNPPDAPPMTLYPRRRFLRLKGALARQRAWSPAPGCRVSSLCERTCERGAERGREYDHMSNQNPPDVPRHTAEETANVNQEIAQFFRQAGDMRSQPRLHGITGVCRFDLTGVGSWSVAANDGEITVIEGAGNALHADCVVACGAEDFLRITHGENHLNLITAAMQGL